MADSIRDALTAAYSAAEKEPEDTSTTETQTPDDVSSTTETQDTSDLSLQGDTAADTDDSGESGGTPPPAVASAPATPAEAPKPPASWNASEREAWASLPEGARAAVLRREQEFDRVLRTSADARKRTQALDSIASPYEPLLQKYGVTIEQAIQPLLATRAALEVGTKEQKAELVANLIADFDIDVEQLDAAIVGRLQHPVQRQQPPAQLDLRNHPELRGLFQMADEVKERRQAAAREALAEVATLPHYEEVRMEMADVLDRARARGKTLDLRQAYNIACQVYGFEGAPAPLSASDAGRALALSRNAASSVAGGLKPAPPRAPGSGSLRDELEANFRSARR